ncbi:MAG: zinc ribbon domain-containing protein [Myxococcota bacterium]
MIDELPEPMPDLDSLPFWEGLKANELRLQKCGACGALRWPARAICNRCSSFAAEWVACREDARIASWIRTHQVFAPAYRDRVPYVVVQVVLDAQPDIRLIGGWQGDRDPVYREAVVPRYVRRASGTVVLDWAPREP